MSLFSNLGALFRIDRFPLEDFHTEIVAQVLKDYPKLTKAWMLSLNAILPDDFESIRIQTQVELPQLDGHFTASRPDIIIHCNGKLGQQIVIVESKIKNQQGEQQLQRYAAHLDRMASPAQVISGSLIFITKDFEDFDKPTFTQQGKRLAFINTRWFYFYRELCAYKNSDALIQQLKLFMKEKRMNTESKFDAANILCLQHWHTTKSLMDETLDGEVNSRGQEILEKSGSPRKAIIQLRNWDRYVLAFYVGKDRDIEILLGYWLEGTQIWIGCMIYSNPTASTRVKIITEFKEWIKSKSELWEHDNLDDPDSWASVFRGKDISQFSAAKDQVRVIKDYFLEILEEVRCFRNETPSLPWKQIAPSDGED